LVHGFLFFIAFNGAVVFKAGVTRWAGIVLTGALAALFGRWVYNFCTQGQAAPCEILHESAVGRRAEAENRKAPA
jgi:hypothetical protein